MSIITANELDDILKELVSKNKKPEKIMIGYKAYSELMNDRNFLHEVASSAMDPNKRKYQKIKIKVTQGRVKLEVRHKPPN